MSTVQALAATQGKHGELILLTDAQICAIFAAAAAPTEPTITEWAADPGVRALNATNEQHVDHIYKVMEANFSLSEIHDLFHSSDNLPMKLTDAEVDAAIAAHPAAGDKRIKRAISSPLPVGESTKPLPITTSPPLPKSPQPRQKTASSST